MTIRPYRHSIPPEILALSHERDLLRRRGQYERADVLKRQIEETDSDYDREKLQERLAKLAGGVAVIQVGAPTETELKEKKQRMEDALEATRAAVEEGIVPGGGVAYLNALPVLDEALRRGVAIAGTQRRGRYLG